MNRLINVVLCLTMLVASVGSVAATSEEAATAEEDARAFVNPGVDFKLLPATQSVKVGTVFTVDIQVDPTAYANGTDGVQASVDFNTTFIKVCDPSGNILPNNATNPIIPIPGNATNLTSKVNNKIFNGNATTTNGTADIAYQAEPGSGANETNIFILGTIRFKALADGTGIPLNFHNSLSRPTTAALGGNNVTRNRTNASLAIEPLTPPTVVTTPLVSGVGAATTSASTPPPVTSPPPTTTAIPTPKMSPNRVALKIESLTVSPLEVNAGESVEISAIVQNTGGDNGIGAVTLRVNGAVETSKDLNVAMGNSEKVTFVVSKETPGKYLVEINGLSSAFTVKTPVLQPSEVSQAGSWSLPFYGWVIIGAGVLIVIIIVGIWWWRRNSYY